MMDFEGFRFDSKAGQLYRHDSDEPVVIRHKLIQLLTFLIEHRDQVVSKEALLTALWDHGQYREHSLSQSILELRKILGDSASSPRYIRTVPNQGFQWICPIVESSKGAVVLPKHSYLIAGSVAILALLLLVAVFVFTPTDSETNVNRNLKVWVLPFDNRTQTQSMNWVEFGLADMMASDLMLIEGLDVIPPAQLSTRLLTEQGNYRSDTAFIQTLLEEASIDIAIKAEVALANNQQTLRYQIISTENKPVTGVIERQDLAVAMPNIVSQLFGQLKPQSEQPALPNYEYVPSAMHEYARGVQALNNEGAILARHYFGASTQIDPSHYWSLAYLGVCQLYLGEWDDAKALLTEVADQDKDPNIQGFVKYWLALLEYRQGNFQQASILLIQVQKLGRTEAKKTPLARRVEQLHARVVLMQSTPNSEQQIDTFTDEFDDLSLIDSFFDTAIENSVNKLKEHVRRLTIKGYKPALFTRLLALSQHDELEVKERQRYLNHALDVINQLQQPYEHAQALLLTVRYGLLYGEASGIDAHQVEAFLEQAKDLAIELDARILLARVEYYQQLVEINEMLTDNPNGAADALKQFSHTLETVPLSTEFTPLVDQLLELGNPNF